MEYTDNIIYFLCILTFLFKFKMKDSGSLSLKMENGFVCSRSKSMVGSKRSVPLRNVESDGQRT